MFSSLSLSDHRAAAFASPQASDPRSFFNSLRNAYVTSVVIPMALGATATAFVAKAIYNLSTGTGKLD